MRRNIIRSALLGILLLGFAIPGAALADDGANGCSNLGTWFGVTPFPPDQVPPPVTPPPPWDVTYLSGWSVSVTGKSNNEGANNFEYPVFDPKFTMLGLEETEPFASAVRIGTMRGNWVRTGGNTFDYTFMGFAYDEANMPAYISKISGLVVLIEDCQYQYTTALMEVYWPYMNPFDEDLEPAYVIPLGVFYGYRAKVDVAPFPF